MTPLQAAVLQEGVATGVATGAVGVVVDDVVAPEAVVVVDGLITVVDVEEVDVPLAALTMAMTMDAPTDTHMSTSSAMPAFFANPMS